MTYEEAKCYKTLRTSYLCISVVIAADTVISLTALVVVVPLAAILVVLTITVLIPSERTGWSFNSFSKKYQAKKVFIFPIDNQKSHFWIVYPVKFWKKKITYNYTTCHLAFRRMSKQNLFDLTFCRTCCLGGPWTYRGAWPPSPLGSPPSAYICFPCNGQPAPLWILCIYTNQASRLISIPPSSAALPLI